MIFDNGLIGRTNIEKVKAQYKEFLRIDILNQPLPDSPQRNFHQGLAWFSHDSLFLMTGPKLLIAHADNNWKWRNLAQVEGYTHSLATKIIENKKRNQIFALTTDYTGQSELHYFNTNLSKGKLKADRIPMLNLKYKELISHSWIDSGNGELFEFVAGFNYEDQIEQVVYKWSLDSNNVTRNRYFAINTDSTIILTDLTRCHFDGGFIGIQYSEVGDSLMIFHFDSKGHQLSRHTTPLLNSLVSADYNEIDISGELGLFPTEAIFSLRHSHIAIIQFGANGLYIVDLDQMQLKAWEWGGYASLIGFELGNTGLVLTELAGGRRLGIWDLR